MELSQPHYIVESAVMPNVTAPKQFPIDRECSEEGCGTVLSRYNSRTECALHTKAADGF